MKDGIGRAGESKKFLPSRTALRWNSYAVPWIELPPDLVVTFTTAPALHPNSAEKFEVCNLNSWIASMEGRVISAPPDWRLRIWELLSTPSSRWLFIV